MTSGTEETIGASPSLSGKKPEKGKLISQLSIDQRDIRVTSDYIVVILYTSLQ